MAHGDDSLVGAATRAQRLEHPLIQGARPVHQRVSGLVNRWQIRRP